MNYLQLTQTLAESFGALADEVQSLIDRKTILEHKLRYAHEQYQYLADKYAPAVPEISETLAKLQLPPELHLPPLPHHVVPLPKRAGASSGGGVGDTQHQIALLIREGRKAAALLSAVMADASGSSKGAETSSLSPAGEETLTAPSTVALEQDFTVEGRRRGSLACPFSKRPVLKKEQDGEDGIPGDGALSARRLSGTAADPTPHRSSDPICAAMLEEAVSATGAANAGDGADKTTSVTAAGASKCPIRYMDQHSPEEIAHYVSTHKHKLPRSHEVCIQRYQRNEEKIRKLDAKYGNLVSMIEDLSHLHRPMLPSSSAVADDGRGEADDEQRIKQEEGEERASNNERTHKRVETWAQTVTSDPGEQDAGEVPPDVAEDRQSHFDRPLRDVRVGESPSRPWGISVPVYDVGGWGSQQGEPVRPASSHAVPVRMPDLAPPHPLPQQVQDSSPVKKCPFDHTKFNITPPAEEAPSHRVEDDHPVPSEIPLRPTFINTLPAGNTVPAAVHGGSTPAVAGAGSAAPQPQMVFNISGPVFIGYPMEQAIQFIQQYQGR